MLLVLTGCIAEQKPKVYTNRVEFLRPNPQKILYKARPVDENCKINFPEPIIAENKMNTYRLYEENEKDKLVILAIRKEIKKIQKSTADLKTAISERKNQQKQVKELKEGLKKINKSI